MTRDELLALLRSQNERDQPGGDPEEWHGTADGALLAYIADPEITEAFAQIMKWYA